MLKTFDKIHNTLSTVENNGLLLPWLGSCFYFFFSFYPTPRRLVHYSYKILDTFPKNYPFLQKYTTKLYKPKKLHRNPEFSNLRGKWKFVKKIRNSKNRRWHQITPVLPRCCAIRNKKAEQQTTTVRVKWRVYGIKFSKNSLA